MFRFSIDRGGTFTDVYAECPGGEVKVMKLLSEDPNIYSDAPREAIRRIMEEVRKLYGISTIVGAQTETAERNFCYCNAQLSVTSVSDPLPVRATHTHSIVSPSI